MREEFEKLPEIAEEIKLEKQMRFNEDENMYIHDDVSLQINLNYLNGAWYAYQEQQKKVDKAIEYLDSIEGLVWYEQIKDILK